MFCSRVVVVVSITATLLVPATARAQYQGHNFRGDLGVNSATQPGPGIYVVMPYAQWNADTIKDADGDPFAVDRFGGFDFRLLAPTVVGVTKLKLLGANYGYMVSVPFSTIRPERADETADSHSWGLTDLYVVPVQLGWHTARADIDAGYGFYAPTGRYEARATDNVGLGMWSHELRGGVTAFLDAEKKLSIATTAFFEMHSKKKDIDIKVGNLLTLEGGAAYNVPQIAGAFGLGYYFQQKVSDDSGADVPTALLRATNLLGRNRTFGIGPDVTMGLFQRGTTAGVVNVRYLWESGAKSTFEGGTFWISMTIAKLRP
jgi:hypothetical protein